MIKFKKMHGLGNDFVILDSRNEPITLSEEQIIHICDRHFGVGCDQLIIMEPSDKADLFMRILNNDGSEAEACGNATRCVSDIVMREQGGESCQIETLRGVLDSSRAEEDLITVDMGEAYLDWQDIPLSEEMETLNIDFGQNDLNVDMPLGCAVGMGNPHLVFFVDFLEDMNVEKLGSFYEHHPFYPRKTNVEFVEQTGANSFRQITWERGTGRTLACGSAACAVAVAAIRRGLVQGRDVEIMLDGGPLQLHWRESDGHVLMTGPVSYVFEGELVA